jgi:two-component system, chemotaxis family, response regulator Rcp1
MLATLNKQGDLGMITSSYAKPIEILLVEDSPDDACLTIEALKDGKVRNRISHVEDGEEAISFLRQKGSHGSAPRPDLILLDLCLPKKNGQEVLEEIKEDPDLRRIPVVILTTIDDREQVREVYNRHANCYINKPVDFDEFIKVVRSIEDFWLTIVKLPAA